jgi:hypothetical protein
VWAQHVYLCVVCVCVCVCVCCVFENECMCVYDGRTVSIPLPE